MYFCSLTSLGKEPIMVANSLPREKTIEEKVIEIIAEQLGLNPKIIKTDFWLGKDLGADSLEVMKLAIELEEEFDIDEFSDNIIFDNDLTVQSIIGEIIETKAS